FFRDDWIRIIRGFFRTLGDVVSTRRLPEDDNDARLAWLIIIATIPVGITGLALEHVFRTIFAKPVAASIFLTVNGLILFAGERIHGQAAVGFVVCGVVAYISVRWLVRYFETNRLTPFAIYSLVVGLISFVHFV